MKKSLRFISLLLMLCFIVVATAACAGEEVKESAQTSNETSEKKELFSTLPEKDYEKKTVTFLVPGDSFGYPGYVRISYCVSTEMIEKSLPSFEKLANEYK